MSSMGDAAEKIEKMIRASRLNDIDLLMKAGQMQRITEIQDALTKLEPGAYLIGCGPYTQGIYRLSAEEVVFGREATLHEKAVGAALDFIVNDSVTFRPREVSRVHFSVSQREIDGLAAYFLADLGSTCGTYLNGALLECQKDGGSTVNTDVSKPLADLDVISLGSGLVNLFLFLIVPKTEGV